METPKRMQRNRELKILLENIDNNNNNNNKTYSPAGNNWSTADSVSSPQVDFLKQRSPLLGQHSPLHHFGAHSSTVQPIPSPSNRSYSKSIGVACPSCEATLDVSLKICEICGEAVSPTEAPTPKTISWKLDGKSVKIRTPTGMREVPVPFPDLGKGGGSERVDSQLGNLFEEAKGKRWMEGPYVTESLPGPPRGAFIVDVDVFLGGGEVGMW
eukprot:CAMPEP_0181316888 /NCGR_PEP_ID=MMETSP1101-20121128/16135_1 /TAXON_ID=46948 /ORGANISM="Rhodomonas abbreviata, Strain Caron Lab Isolate" /LENGTH=212 /DNA_ID=CAMNT_0023424165 /DNA_START=250 /DNA_END=885 /DNA_ORIENTATION=-